jgi:hypothetical protein
MNITMALHGSLYLKASESYQVRQVPKVSPSCFSCMGYTMFFCLRPMNPTYEKSKILFRLHRWMFLAHPRFVQGRLRGWWWHSRRPEDRPKMAGMGRMGCIKPSGKPWETQFKADVFLNEQFHQSNFRLIYIYTVYNYSIYLQYTSTIYIH